MKQISWNSSIAAILPHYSAHGDITMVMKSDGSNHILNMKIRNAVRRLATLHATDLTALKQQTSPLTQRANFQPLPLTTGFVLVPVKVRIPRIPGDSTIGYINLHAVSTVQEKLAPPYQTELSLTGNWTIPVIWSAPTIHKHLQQAKLSATVTPRQPPVPEELNLIAQKMAQVFYEIMLLKRA